MKSFSINYQLTLSDYRKLSMSLFYSRIAVIVMSIVAVLYVLCSVELYILGRHDILNDYYYGYGIVAVILSVYLPVSNYFRVKRSFNGNTRLGESITFDFSEDGITQTGESFNSKYDWVKLYKVRIFKQWLLIYHNRTVANIIKISPDDQENIEELKQFLKSGNFNIKLNW